MITTFRTSLSENLSSQSILRPGVWPADSSLVHSTPSRLSMTSSPLPMPASKTVPALDPENWTRTWPLVLLNRKSGSARRTVSVEFEELYGQMSVTIALIHLVEGAERCGESCAMGIWAAAARSSAMLSVPLHNSIRN